MFIIACFAGAAPSLFDHLTTQGRVSIVTFDDLGVTRLSAADPFAEVFGWKLTGLPRSPLPSLRPPVGGPTIENLAWIGETLADAQRVVFEAGDDFIEQIGDLDIIEAWQTIGMAGHPARWLRCRVRESTHEMVIFQGRRGQFMRHTVGWDPRLGGADEIVVLTTEPERLPTLAPYVPAETPMRAIAMPKPADWKPSTATDASAATPAA